MALSAKTRRLITALLATVYAGAMICSHEWAQQFIRHIQQDTTWTWTAVVVLAALLVLLTIILFRRRRLLTVEKINTGLLISWAVSIAAVSFAQWLLVSVHTEAIHYIQYGLLTAMVPAVTRRIPATLIVVISVGILDEAYQYWFLYPGWPVYYDMNDVLLNVLAAGLALLYLASAFPQWFIDEDADRWIVKNIDLVILVGISLLLVAGIATGLIALYRYPEEASADAILIMNRDKASGAFWSHAWWSDRYYHRMSLVNGMIALVLIAQYYRFTLPLLVRKNPS